jgi:signal transduction histidine kinase
LDPAVELTAYRVVQEALTNALRHAGRSTVRVTLAWADGALALDILDTGAAAGAGAAGAGAEPSQPVGGRGLLGLAERVRAHGGELRTGTTPDGGHHVAARLPGVPV